MQTSNKVINKEWYKLWWVWFPVISIIFMLLTLLWVNYENYKTDSSAIATIFDVYKGGSNSGVTGYEYKENTLNIAYNLYPIGISEIDDEIGILLAKKFKKLYQKRPNIDSITFYISLPYSNAYGDIQWRLYMSFNIDRNLITNKINWDNFNSQNFLKVVYNLKKY